MAAGVNVAAGLPCFEERAAVRICSQRKELHLLCSHSNAVYVLGVSGEYASRQLRLH
jgi:hypothetical protein